MAMRFLQITLMLEKREEDRRANQVEYTQQGTVRLRDVEGGSTAHATSCKKQKKDTVCNAQGQTGLSSQLKDLIGKQSDLKSFFDKFQQCTPFLQSTVACCRAIFLDSHAEKLLSDRSKSNIENASTVHGIHDTFVKFLNTNRGNYGLGETEVSLETCASVVKHQENSYACGQHAFFNGLTAALHMSQNPDSFPPSGVFDHYDGSLSCKQAKDLRQATGSLIDMVCGQKRSVVYCHGKHNTYFETTDLKRLRSQSYSTDQILELHHVSLEAFVTLPRVLHMFLPNQSSLFYNIISKCAFHEMHHNKRIFTFYENPCGNHFTSVVYMLPGNFYALCGTETLTLVQSGDSYYDASCKPFDGPICTLKAYTFHRQKINALGIDKIGEKLNNWASTLDVPKINGQPGGSDSLLISMVDEFVQDSDTAPTHASVLVHKESDEKRVIGLLLSKSEKKSTVIMLMALSCEFRGRSLAQWLYYHHLLALNDFSKKLVIDVKGCGNRKLSRKLWGRLGYLTGDDTGKSREVCKLHGDDEAVTIQYSGKQSVEYMLEMRNALYDPSK